MITDKCDECGKDVPARGVLTMFDDGSFEVSDDLFEAECVDCGRSWIITDYL